jgi:hypothetical protein
MSDVDIAKVNSMFLGFSSSDLSQLLLRSTISINALGTLTGWSADQVIIED